MFIKAGIACILAFLILDHVVIHMHSYKNYFNMNTAWIQDIQNEPDATYAVSWIPSTVAGFSNNWVVGIQPGNEAIIAKRYKEGGQLFTADDLFLFGQKDYDAKTQYLKPDYWVYFQTDKLNPFDAFNYTLKQDYILRFIHKYITNKRIVALNPWISEKTVAPSSEINFGGTLELNRDDVIGMELLQPSFTTNPHEVPYIINNAHSAPVLYSINLRIPHRRYYGEYIIPGAYKEILLEQKAERGILVLPVAAVFADGSKKILNTYTVNVDLNADVITTLKYKQNNQQPSIQELIVMMDKLPIKSEHDGYVIFDLKGMH